MGLKEPYFRKRSLNTEEGPMKKYGQKKAVPEDSEEECEGSSDDDDEADDPSPENAYAIVEEGVRVQPLHSF